MHPFTSVVSALFLGLSSISSAGAAPGAPPVTVEIKSLGYAPKKVEIQAGQTVIWKNTALTRHSAITSGGDKFLNTGLIAPGGVSKPILFAMPGHYFYHCSIHGKTMGGEIVVQGVVPGVAPGTQP